MRLTANHVTISRIVLMPIPVWLLYGSGWELIAALVAITLLGITDYIDGLMARRDGPTVLGGLLDPVADKIFIAVIYLPLTERGVIPVWMTALVFARDGIVTTLRTSLLLRDAPMRTSTLAKYKTAIQMFGLGYVIAYLSAPGALWTWIASFAVVAVPIVVVLRRLASGRPQGPRSWAMVGLTGVCPLLRWVFGEWGAIQITLGVITVLAVVSGFSYLVDAWAALRGRPGSLKEAARFVLDGVLVPVSIILLLGRIPGPEVSALLILAFALELAGAGLGNLLGSRKILPRFRLVAAKSLTQVALAALALLLALGTLPYPELPLPLSLAHLLVLLLFSVTLAYAVLAFWKHRKVYLAAF